MAEERFRPKLRDYVDSAREAMASDKETEVTRLDSAKPQDKSHEA